MGIDAAQKQSNQELTQLYKKYHPTAYMLRELVLGGKITTDEMNTYLKIERIRLGPCFECPHNDGTPNSYCYNCDR